MDRERGMDTLSNEINSAETSSWLWILPLIMLYLRRGEKKLSINEIDINSLEKKSRLLGRIKGYMSPEEQLIVHRAEMLLHIISKTKAMMDSPDIYSGSTYSSLSMQDKKRHMLMDISEFVDEDRREVIHKALDMHLKANHMGTKMREIQGLQSSQMSIENVEKYIELFDPILEGQLKNKTNELKVLMGMLKLMKSLEKKEQIDEMDIVEMIKPFVSQDQRDQLVRMVQLVKVFSTIGNDPSPSPSLTLEEEKSAENQSSTLKVSQDHGNPTLINKDT